MSNLNHKILIQSDHVLVKRPQDFEVKWSQQPAMLKEIWTNCQTSGLKKVLIVGSSTKVNLSVLDIFDLGKEIAKLGLQIAVVEIHDATKEEVQFLENVVINRGSPIQFFDNEQDAKEWLGLK